MRRVAEARKHLRRGHRGVEGKRVNASLPHREHQVSQDNADQDRTGITKSHNTIPSVRASENTTRPSKQRTRQIRSPLEARRRRM